MNPSYPSNGSPFPQPHPAYHHHASTPGHSSNGVNSNPMAAQNHPSPYAYPVHHTPYASHPSFPHYSLSPYPQQIMMYAPPRPSAAHEAVSQPSPTASQSSVSLVQLTSGKRKRRPTDESQAEGSEETAGVSGSVPGVMASGPRANGQHPLPPDSKKRTKTQRACDSCRSRKIRSVVLFSLAAICSGPSHSYSHGF